MLRTKDLSKEKYKIGLAAPINQFYGFYLNEITRPSEKSRLHLLLATGVADVSHQVLPMQPPPKYLKGANSNQQWKI